MHLAFCPGERSGVLAVAGDEVVDVRLELNDSVEGRAVQRRPAEDGESDLDLIEPGRMGRRVVEMKRCDDASARGHASACGSRGCRGSRGSPGPDSRPRPCS